MKIQSRPYNFERSRLYQSFVRLGKYFSLKFENLKSIFNKSDDFKKILDKIESNEKKLEKIEKLEKKIQKLEENSAKKLEKMETDFDKNVAKIETDLKERINAKISHYEHNQDTQHLYNIITEKLTRIELVVESIKFELEKAK